MEALQMIKFHIKHEDCFNFTAGFTTTPEELIQMASRDVSELTGRDLLGELAETVGSKEREDALDLLLTVGE